jgi:hypothetical protein
MAGSILSWLAALALVALTAVPARAEGPEAPGAGTASAAEPTAEALAQAWFDQLYGGNSVAIWTSEWGGSEFVLGVARRWEAGRPEVFVHVFSPRVYDELNFLLRERDEQRLELLYFRTPKLFRGGQKAARVATTRVPDPLERLPFAEGLPAVVDVEPVRAGDYVFTRLPDTKFANRPCRVIEGKPRATNLGFDLVRITLASETGVALETAWFQSGEIVRRAQVDPADVRDYDGRALPSRITVERPGNSAQIFSVRSLRLDPPLPDQLFTTQNLRLGHFPSY